MNAPNPFSKLSQLNRPQFGSGEGSQNLTIRVTGYVLDGKDPSRHLVVGKNVLTGEEVKVSLRAPKDEAETKAFEKRPVIADDGVNKNVLSGTRKAGSCKVGGIIMFEQAYKDAKTGNWSGRWPHILSHDDKEGRLVIGMAQVLPPRKNERTGKVSQQVLIFDTEKAVEPSGKDLTKAVAAAIEAGGQGGGAIIRVIDGEYHEDVALYRGAKFNDAKEIIGQLTGEETVNQYLSENEKGKLVAELMKNENIKFVVIPASRYFYGGDTAMENDKRQGYSRAESPYQFRDAEGKPAGGLGVAQSIVALHKANNGEGEFVLRAFPVKGRPELVARAMMQAGSFVPKHMPVSAQNQAAAGADAGDDLDPTASAQPDDFNEDLAEKASAAAKTM